MDVKLLTEANLEDAKSIIRSRMSESACLLLEKEMRNPLRKLNDDFGDVVYDEEKHPICVQVCVIRQCYFGKLGFVGKVGGTTCIRVDAPAEAIVDVQAGARRQRAGSVLSYGNTMNRASEKMAKIMKAHLGPSSWERFRFRAVRPLDFLWYCISRKILKRPIPNWPDNDWHLHGDFVWQTPKFQVRWLKKLNGAELDDFWHRYVSMNEGIVGSRTSEELLWIFGDEIKTRQCVFLGCYQKDQLQGYVILKARTGACRRWLVMDWIAFKNDCVVLDILMNGACRFLRTSTPAMLLECIGFPPFVQGILSKYLPYARKTGNNLFSYSYYKARTTGRPFAEACEAVILSPKSWFFGPYDGDMCLCY